MKFITNKKNQWCDFLSDEYRLPVNVSLKERFSGEILLKSLGSNIITAKVHAVPHQLKSRTFTDSFIFINTNKSFKWKNGKQSGIEKQGTIVIDCASDYIVDFFQGNFTRSFIVPYENFSSSEIDIIKSKKYRENYMISDYINSIFNTIHTVNDSDIESKINVIKNISVLNVNNDDFIGNAKDFMFNRIINNKRLNLEILANYFNCCPRALQYRFKKYNTSYLKLEKEIMYERFLLNKNDIFLYEKAIKSGFNSVSSLYLTKSKEKLFNLINVGN